MTTHSMEEAEICCQKFGIMANGCLATIGSLFDLRERYGLGYKLFIEVEPDYSNFEAQRFVESLLPSPFTKSQSMINILKYEFVPGSNDVPRLFQLLAAHGKDHGIVDWKLSQKSLEDIFLTLVKEDDGICELNTDAIV